MRDPLPDTFLPWSKVRPMTGDLGRATVWRMMKTDQFPQSVLVSPGRRAWRQSDILAWQGARAPKSEPS